jgi:carbonic anhydrase
MHAFADILAGNETYATTQHQTPAPTGYARRGLAIVTCIDSRIDPLAVFGLVPGDAKILRNAGARITPDVCRSLAVSVALLGVERVAVVQHTGCRMLGATEAELAAAVAEAGGTDTSGWEFLPIADHDATLAEDIAALRACAVMPPRVEISGFVLDLETGILRAAG